MSFPYWRRLKYIYIHTTMSQLTFIKTYDWNLPLLQSKLMCFLATILGLHGKFWQQTGLQGEPLRGVQQLPHIR